MAEPPERLFRDDAGAALERVARLEEENKELRAALARRRYGAHPRSEREAPTVRTTRSNVARAAVGFSLALMLLGTVLSVRASRPTPRVPTPTFGPRTIVTPHVTTASPLIAAPAATATDVEAEDDCSPPYTYDERRVKHYKLHCIHPERAPR